MKILFTCNEYPPYSYGGQGIFIKEISRNLADRNHTVVVYGVYSGITTRQIENTGGVIIIRDPMTFPDTSILKMFKNRMKYGGEISSIVKEYNIDVIEAHDTGGWFAFINCRKPLFVRLHNGERYFRKRGFNTVFFERLSFAYKRVTIIAVSRFILKEFNSFFRLKNPFNSYALIYNGIRANKINITDKQNTKSIIYAGTLKPIKGVDILIKAFILSNLHKQGYSLNILGKDTITSAKEFYREYLLKTIDGLSEMLLDKHIVFEGQVSKEILLQKYAQSEICVFPSRFESFGLAVVEAMSMGALVIYSDQGAATELIDNGNDGFLVEVDNYPKWSQTMIEVLSLPDEEKERIKENAVKKAAKFSIERCAEETLCLFKSKLQ